MTEGPPPDADTALRVGAGRADITPLADVGLFGYGSLTQIAAGLEQRLYARAFAVADADARFVFVSCDLGYISQALREHVVDTLRDRLGGRYPPESVCISATHTHSAPGGYSAHVLYNASIRGHSQRVFDTLSQGIVAAIEAADAALQPGHLSLAGAPLDSVGINRTIEAYRCNPEVDDPHGEHAVDRRMTQLCLWRADDTLLGLVNWFPVHCTSYDKNNRLISGDNKGYASLRLERELPGVVAAFAQANSGDVSPNRRLTPDGLLVGEGGTPRKSVRLVGDRQADAALALLHGPQTPISGPVRARLAYVDLSDLTLPGSLTTTGAEESVGPAVLGQTFMVGTKDGRGPAWFEGGDAERSLLVALFARGISPMSAEEERRHAPKKTFLRLDRGRGWVPNRLPFQVISVGTGLCIGALP
ncbi:MAG: neutral ceramidase, partial [Myxococcota bacterium]